jgi:adenylylsulfate kinase
MGNKMTERILIMGLPGAGKTYLAQYVLEWLERANKKCIWINADRVRTEYNDWDFTIEGRIRQSKRMREMADRIECDYVIADFVCPLVEMRNNFNPDYIIWMDTVKTSVYEDTNQMFIQPERFSFRLTQKDAEKWSEYLAINIIKLDSK